MMRRTVELGACKWTRNATSEWKKIVKVGVQNISIETVRNVESQP